MDDRTDDRRDDATGQAGAGPDRAGEPHLDERRGGSGRGGSAPGGLTGRLRDQALTEGAAGFGVCGPEPFDEVRDEMIRRRSDGSAGRLTFTYKDPHLATDVTRSFPWAASLVAVAWPYVPAAGSPGDAAPGTGRVARFATGDRYEGLRALLDGLAGLLRAQGHRAEALCDDDRLVDRAAAVRAGVGWWGKSTMVLVPGAGPWVLLGTVVTDAVLERSAPMARSCGTCTACIPACPTGAIVAPGMLDARRCLAAIAQAPGPIPEEFREPMGDRVYGCDECLDACPPGHPVLQQATAPAGRHDLAAILGASDEALLAEFAHFYLPSRDPRHLRRNALVAAGNSGAPDLFPVVAGYCGHPDAMLREHARWALPRIDPDRAAPVLGFVGGGGEGARAPA